MTEPTAVRRGRVRVGVSGWRYPRWRGDFYPRGLPQRSELTYLAERMDTIELNGSFYSLQRPTSYQRWRTQVPDDVVLAVKGSRYITHMLGLREVDQALANFFASGVLALGRQLGPVLWQLPERHELDVDQLQRFLGSLPRTTGEALDLARHHDARLDDRAWLEIDEDPPLRHAFEPRASSFVSPVVDDLLHEHGVALAVADTAGRWPMFGRPRVPTRPTGVPATSTSTSTTTPAGSPRTTPSPSPRAPADPMRGTPRGWGNVPTAPPGDPGRASGCGAAW